MAARSGTAPEDLEVTVHTVGGVFGIDRLTHIRDNTMTVTIHGDINVERELPDRAQAEVSALAHGLVDLHLPQPPEPGYVADGGSTTIEISLGGARQRIVVHAGDDAPQPVWDLLDGLERIQQQEE